VAVHVGEWGCFNRTPHDVALAWMGAYLSLWKEAGWGWALWNLRGSFGVMDSEREDVPYEDFEGHKLDRKMLDLLRRAPGLPGLALDALVPPSTRGVALSEPAGP
jgi:endoglucanase